MKLKTREYQRGDEHDINKLYKRVANIDRNQSEYDWEWIHTWDGPGFVRLMFDEDRAEGDQLVAQYSLIPTPFSVWGKPFLAGKTENCMCHPDYRGKGIYFPHEKKSFEEARQRFQLFFTTSGNMTKGAPGAVRRKLGYIAFDSWIHFVYITDNAYIRKALQTQLNKYVRGDSRFVKFLTLLISRLVYFFFALKPGKKILHDIRLRKKDEVSLADIERLWICNKREYGVSIDRTSSYLDWRINSNPYQNHSYLCAYDRGSLIGYIIFYEAKDTMIHVMDILVDRKDEVIFSELIQALILYAKKKGAGAVRCTTLSHNMLLKKMFRKNGFVSFNPTHSIGMFTSKNKRQNPFNVFVSETVDTSGDILDPCNWYITDLIKEGRSS